MLSGVIVVFLLGLSGVPSESARLSRCRLARALREAGFRHSLIPDWVCLVEAESSRNTTARGGPNKNGSYDHGLFQINDRYWCEMGKPGKDCKVKCEDLESDDLSASMECAKVVYRRHKFQAWHGWVKKCKDKPLPDIEHCLEEFTTPTPDTQTNR